MEQEVMCKELQTDCNKIFFFVQETYSNTENESDCKKEWPREVILSHKMCNTGIVGPWSCFKSDVKMIFVNVRASLLSNDSMFCVMLS